MINLVQIRESFINIFCTKIRVIENKERLIKNTCSIKFLNCIPFCFKKNILNCCNFKYLYEQDEIIYYSIHPNINSLQVIGPLLIEIEVNNKDVKEIFDNYYNNVPIRLIFFDSDFEIDDSSSIYIKYKKKGKLYEKKTNFNSVKNLTKIELLNCNEEIYSPLN